MSTLTKLAYDKTIAEMHTTNRVHNRRLELGVESPSLRTSGSGLIFNDNGASSDSDSDASNGSNGSYGSFGRHSFINISEESSGSPSSSMGASYAFMTS